MVVTRVIATSALGMILAGNANAFRACGIADSHAYTAVTRYTVGEIAFDDASGLAAGTETTFNYANSGRGGTSECHVTYELNGNYVPGVEVFVLAATRSNYSPSCPSRGFELEYPADRLYSLQLEIDDAGSTVVSSADSGEFIARGSWGSGRAVYKTDEKCTYF